MPLALLILDDFGLLSDGFGKVEAAEGLSGLLVPSFTVSRVPMRSLDGEEELSKVEEE